MVKNLYLNEFTKSLATLHVWPKTQVKQTTGFEGNADTGKPLNKKKFCD